MRGETKKPSWEEGGGWLCGLAERGGLVWVGGLAALVPANRGGPLAM